MNKTTVLGLSAVALAAVLGTLAYKVWDHRQGGAETAAAVMPPVAAPVAEIPATPLPPPPLPEPAPAPAPPADDAASAAALEAARKFAASNSREARQAQSMRRSLDELPYWVSLTDAEKDQIAPSVSVLRSVRIFIGSPEQTAQWEQEQRDAARRIEQAVGPAKYALWREYHDSERARMDINGLNSRLGDAALQEDVIRTLAAAIAPAQKRVEDEYRTKYGSDRMHNGSVESFDLNQEKERRLAQATREAARPLLPASQYQAFDEFLQLRQSNMERNRALMRERAAAQEARSNGEGGG